MRKRRRIRFFLLLGVAALATALGLLAHESNVFNRLELDSIDARFSIRGTRKPPKDLIVVGIDAKTFDVTNAPRSDVGGLLGFPRSLHAKVINRLKADGAKVIAYDVQFTEQTTPKEDNALINAVGDAGNLVLSTIQTDHGKTNVLGGDDLLKELNARPGHTQLPDDPGGVKRRLQYSIDGLKTFGVVATERDTGKPVSPKPYHGDQNWIDFYGPPGTIPEISFADVLKGHFKPGTFKGKVVVVGATDATIKDIFPTATTGSSASNSTMSGPELQANVIGTVREGLPLRSSRDVWDVLAIVLLALAAPILSLKLKPGVAIGIALGLGVVWTLLAQLVFDAGHVVAFVTPILTLMVSTVAALMVHYFTETRERRRVRQVFARFVPENVVDQVLDRTDGDLRLGGVQREGTVMFSDLRGFTSFAESLPVTRVIEVLNKYLGEMSEAILDHGGTLVAYMGDGIMAVFGAPIESNDHADRALAAAREMLGKRLDVFNQYLRDEGLHETGFRMGLGLNSGPVMSGNVGSERRLEYTAIGDTTNTAARLEGMTKGTAHMLFVAEAVRDMLQVPDPELFFVDEFEVRGREAKIRLWSLPQFSDAVPAGGMADGGGRGTETPTEP